MTDETAAAVAPEKKKKKAPAPKAAKPVKAKPAPAKRADGAGRQRKYADTAVIHLLDGENPFRPDSSRAKRFAAMKEGMTVGKLLETLKAKDLPANLFVLEEAVERKLAKVTNP